ncbi:efflux RND transporter periplasmic adaptor subunit [Hyalangium versicolor]|uniref:efflux RND transporter periplasmic adaptor subunit n=1 Tax=Hyalangium versicolor TaxID=2861190 RepID=UPI001CCF9033|nr:efflux RND transporter periplasmic adaptor subunit [Hyalangium versicolor]
MKKWLKRALLALGALAVVAAIASAYRPRPVPVDLAEVTRGLFEVTVTEPGKTRVKDRYTISAPVGGHLERISLKPGDEVQEGQVIAQLDSLTPPLLDARSRAEADAQVRAAQAAREQAEAVMKRAQTALEYARSEVARHEQLAASGSITRQSLEAARFEERGRAQELTSAQYAVRIAEQQLKLARAARGRMEQRPTASEQLDLHAPVRGWVLRVMQESEGAVTPGTALMEIGDPEVLEVVVDVLSQDAVRIHPGARARIENWGGDYSLEGRVRRVEPSAFTRVSALGVEEQRVNVLITLEESVERRKVLGDGYRVEARITLWADDDVVQVPESALLRQGEGWAVFLAENKRVRLREVKPGQRNGLQAQVLEGLNPGDRVIVHPGDDVKDGVAFVERSKR